MKYKLNVNSDEFIKNFLDNQYNYCNTCDENDELYMYKNLKKFWNSLTIERKIKYIGLVDNRYNN